MPTPTPRTLPATVLALAAAGIFQFATPFALCGQESGTITARARVVEATGAWEAHRLVEEHTARSLEGTMRARATLGPGAHRVLQVSLEDREGFLAERRGRGASPGLIGEPKDANGEGAVPGSPPAATKPAMVLREAGHVVLQEEHFPSGIRITVADLGR